MHSSSAGTFQTNQVARVEANEYRCFPRTQECDGRLGHLLAVEYIRRGGDPHQKDAPLTIVTSGYRGRSNWQVHTITQTVLWRLSPIRSMLPTYSANSLSGGTTPPPTRQIHSPGLCEQAKEEKDVYKPHPTRIERAEGRRTFLECRHQALVAAVGGKGCWGDRRCRLRHEGFRRLEGCPEQAMARVHRLSLAAQACGDRDDVLVPGEAIRDEVGRVIGCNGLIRTSEA